MKPDRAVGNEIDVDASAGKTFSIADTVNNEASVRSIASADKSLFNLSSDSIVDKSKCLEAVDAEPEFTDEMPEEMWEAIKGDKDAVEQLLRLTVAATKAGIRERIMAI